MGKLELKMHFKKFYVKIVKSGFNWYGSNQHTIVIPDKFYEKLANFVAVAVLVAKIRIFEISAGTLCLPPPPHPSKTGLKQRHYVSIWLL